VRTKCVCAAFLFLLFVGTGLAQDCPPWGDTTAALKFLAAQKLHGTEVDPACVDRAFATLSHDKSAAEALIGLLDFERSVERDSFKTRGGQYPAIGALMTIGSPAIPFLIKAIKDNDSELVRNNAAEALAGIHRPCLRGAIENIEVSARKPGTTAEQRTRLRAAEDYLRKTFSPCKSEAS
jgi:hypothetical protein